MLKLDLQNGNLVKTAAIISTLFFSGRFRESEGHKHAILNFYASNSLCSPCLAFDEKESVELDISLKAFSHCKGCDLTLAKPFVITEKSKSRFVNYFFRYAFN